MITTPAKDERNNKRVKCSYGTNKSKRDSNRKKQNTIAKYLRNAKQYQNKSLKKLDGEAVPTKK